MNEKKIIKTTEKTTKKSLENVEVKPELSLEDLERVAGGRMRSDPDKTTLVTSAGVTSCCWTTSC